MKTLEKKIEVMQAALAGAKIECKDNDEEECMWQCANNPCWGWDEVDYRIKPENKQVPFEISDYESKLGKKFKHKNYESSTGILISVDSLANRVFIGKFEFDFNLAGPHLEWYNELLNRWEACTKTVKG